MRPADLGNFQYTRTPMRRRLVFIEGIDGSGKTTLYRNVMHLSGHDLIFCPTGPMGRTAWARIDGSKERGYFLQDIESLEMDLIDIDAYAIVWLATPVEVCQKRIAERCQPILDPVPTLAVLKEAFDAFEHEFLARWTVSYSMDETTLLRVDNSELSPIETARRVLEWAGSTLRSFSPSAKT